MRRPLLQYGADYDPAGMMLGLDGLTGMQPPAAPPPPPQAAPRGLRPEEVIPPQADPSKMRKLGAFILEGFGASPRAVRDVLDPDASKRAQAALKQRMALARRLWPDDEEAQLLYVSGDENFMKALAKRQEPEKLSEGDEIAPNQRTARKNVRTAVGVTDGYGYTGDAVSGIKFGPQRGKSHAEVEVGRHNARTEDQEDRKIDLDETEHVDEEARKATEHDPTPSVLRKVAEGLPLTPGEERIFKAWEVSKTRDPFGQAAPTDDRPNAGGKPPPKAKPDAAKFTEGKEYVQQGNVYKYVGGKFVYVRPAPR